MSMKTLILTLLFGLQCIAISASHPHTPRTSENSFTSLKITKSDKVKINDLLATMADNNVMQLLFEKKRLEKIGDEIYHVHPLRFLGYIFNDPKLTNDMAIIKMSSFKWNGFIDGIDKKLNKEARMRNVEKYIPGFAKYVGVPEGQLMRYVRARKFEQMIAYILNQKHA